MENITSNSMVITHRGSQYGLKELSEQYKATKIDLKIIEARSIGLSISQVPTDDLLADLQDVLVSISVISGHGLPEDDFFADRLSKELVMHLNNFGYGDLTMCELVLAFNLNCKCGLKYPSGSDIIATEIFGKYISVDYVSRVLSTYKTLRTMLDNHLKNIIDGY